MQDEINEKTIALYIKTGKLTAQTLQKAMKTLLAQMKKQKDKTPQGKQTLKQLIALGAGLGIWGVINLLEGYGNDNPGANAHVR